MHVIAYPHIPPQTLFPPSAIKLVRSNIKVTAKKVGYIMGAGDEMPDALRQLGLEVTLLSESDLAQGDLSRFDAIVAGVRAYNVRADIRANQPRLMRVRGERRHLRGAVSDRRQPGPDRAAQPAAAARTPFSQQHARYRSPRTWARIPSRCRAATIPRHGGRGAGDLPASGQPAAAVSESHQPEGFRGLGAGARRVLRRAVGPEVSDRDRSRTIPAKRPLEGGEIWTRYGKGVYIFTAYSWFRQLPAGVPGAYRLFANLLSAK